MSEKRLGPWVVRSAKDNSWQRFADPHDGRFWELDGSPKCIIWISSCCRGEKQHFNWIATDPHPETGERMFSPNEKTLEASKESADIYLRSIGWTFE